MAYHLVKFNPAMNVPPTRMFIPGRICNWGSSNPLPKGYQKGDTIVFWESGSGCKAVVALGEAYAAPIKCGRESRFDIIAKTGYLDTGVNQDVLRAEPLFDGATFLKAAVAATVYPLTDEQGVFLLGSVQDLLGRTYSVEGNDLTVFDGMRNAVVTGKVQDGLLDGPVIISEGIKIHLRLVGGREDGTTRFTDASGHCTYFRNESLLLDDGDSAQITFCDIQLLRKLDYHGRSALDVVKEIAGMLTGGGVLPSFSAVAAPDMEEAK